MLLPRCPQNFLTALVNAIRNNEFETVKQLMEQTEDVILEDSVSLVGTER